MEMDSAPDLLSDLPLNVIESVLELLPLRDAVKTSILSRGWRYRWASLTQLIFDDSCVNSSTEKGIVESDMIKAVTTALFLHRGLIHKFKLSASFLHSCPDIDRWLLFVLRNEIRELSLELSKANLFRMPSCLFSCQNLTCLELLHCKLEPPADFKGFLSLRNLILRDVSVSSESLEILISSCPLLENFTLAYFENAKMNIAAPNLKYLCLEGNFRDISLAYMPYLTDLSITLLNIAATEQLHKSSVSKFSKVLGSVPNIERLFGDAYFTQYLSVDLLMGPGAADPLMYDCLKVLELRQVNLDDLREMFVVMSLLIMRAPELRELHLSFSSDMLRLDALPEQSFLSTIGLPRFAFKKLQVVKVTDLLGTPEEMQFMKFVLRYSRVLRTMIIEPSQDAVNGKLSMSIDLLKFKRASPHAEIVFVNV